jgi:hypothetical protein
VDCLEGGGYVLTEGLPTEKETHPKSFRRDNESNDNPNHQKLQVSFIFDNITGRIRRIKLQRIIDKK